LYKDFYIEPPFFEIGLKAYLYGEGALRLAKQAERISEKYDVRIIFTPQYTDIPLIAQNTRHLLVFAQHIDPIPVGRGNGAVLAEGVRAAGAVGVLLNHSEKTIPVEVIAQTIQRADEVGLGSMVCATGVDDVAQIASLQPNIVLAEAPELIGGGLRTAEDMQAITRMNAIVWKINPAIRVLHGAGISNAQDVYEIILAGAQATGSTSGVILAPDPLAMLEEMIRAVREAWDTSQDHKKQEVSHGSLS